MKKRKSPKRNIRKALRLPRKASKPKTLGEVARLVREHFPHASEFPDRDQPREHQSRDLQFSTSFHSPMLPNVIICPIGPMRPMRPISSLEGNRV
jgi:hypothetical protein